MNKILALSLALALPILAQAPPTLAPNSAQSMDAFKVLAPVLEGDIKVPLSMGTYDAGTVHANAATYIPIVDLFASGTIQPLKVVGEFSDVKAPAGLKRIALPGYSPKTLGMYGTVLLCKTKVDDGNRIIKTKDMQVEKAAWKPLLDSAKLAQNPDGAWAIEILKPLEPGHYVVTFLKGPVAYWDFDVK